ncbi:MAG: hypothetical protein MJ252_14935 [archaeon]|nr:hypothetical protein [archaeon]
MDKIRKDINDSISLLFSTNSKIYSEINNNLNKSYLEGQKEAYEEILNLISLSVQSNGTKYITPSQFSNFISDKQLKSKIISREEDNEGKCLEMKRKFHKINFNQMDNYIPDNFPHFNSNPSNNFNTIYQSQNYLANSQFNIPNINNANNPFAFNNSNTHNNIREDTTLINNSNNTSSMNIEGNTIENNMNQRQNNINSFGNNINNHMNNNPFGSMNMGNNTLFDFQNNRRNK